MSILPRYIYDSYKHEKELDILSREGNFSLYLLKYNEYYLDKINDICGEYLC